MKFCGNRKDLDTQHTIPLSEDIHAPFIKFKKYYIIERDKDLIKNS